MRDAQPIDRLADAPEAPRPPRPGRRAWWWPIALILLLAAGAGLWLLRQHQATPMAAAAAPPPPEVDVSTPLQKTLARWTDFTGQFSAIDQVDLRARGSGYPTEIHVTDGQLVRRGDLLFVIDPRPYDIALQQAMAQQQTAEAALDLANRQVSRTGALTRDEFASRDLFDQRIQAQRAAVASIAQAKAAIRAAQLNLEFTRITAPFSGRVSNRRVSIGSLISGGPDSAGGTLLTSIVSLDPIHLDFDMSEADYLVYQRFLATKPADLDNSVRVALGDERSWVRRGVLNFIDNQVDRGSGTLHARATLDNPDLLLTPGQFARLRLPVSAARPVLLVPDAALVTDQSHKLLMVVGADGTVVPKPVQIGAIEGNQLRVIDGGIDATDRVVINGLMRVRPGAKVTAKQGNVALAAEQ